MTNPFMWNTVGPSEMRLPHWTKGFVMNLLIILPPFLFPGPSHPTLIWFPSFPLKTHPCSKSSCLPHFPPSHHDRPTEWFFCQMDYRNWICYVIIIRANITSGCQSSMYVTWRPLSPSHNSDKGWANWKPATLLGFIQELRSQGRLLPPKLKRQISGYIESQLTGSDR